MKDPRCGSEGSSWGWVIEFPSAPRGGGANRLHAVAGKQFLHRIWDILTQKAMNAKLVAPEATMNLRNSRANFKQGNVFLSRMAPGLLSPTRLKLLKQHL
jgi:hypothetical protein